MKAVRFLGVILFIASINTTTNGATKKKDQLESKIKTLVELSGKEDGLISMDSTKFKTLVRQQPRNYSVFVMFSALRPERKCQACKVGFEAFRSVSYSWKLSKYYRQNMTDVFFAYVDYDTGAEVFQMMKLHGAPSFRHFPMHDSLKSRHDKFDINVKGLDSDGIARWVSERLAVQKFKISQPPDYTRVLMLGGVVISCLIIGISQRRHLHHLYNRQIWAVLILCFSCTFMSGQMWNAIRNPPFSNKNHRTGEQNYIVRSTGSQYVVETYIVAVLYLSTTVGMIMMNEVHNKKWPRWLKQGLAFGGVAIYFIFANLILALFQAKQRGYPYNFLISL